MEPQEMEISSSLARIWTRDWYLAQMAVKDLDALDEYTQDHHELNLG